MNGHHPVGELSLGEAWRASCCGSSARHVARQFLAPDARAFAGSVSERNLLLHRDHFEARDSGASAVCCGVRCRGQRHDLEPLRRQHLRSECRDTTGGSSPADANLFDAVEIGAHRANGLS